MAPLPTRKVPGVGRVQEKVLQQALGVRTCGELRAAPNPNPTPTPTPTPNPNPNPNPNPKANPPNPNHNHDNRLIGRTPIAIFKDVREHQP